MIKVLLIDDEKLALEYLENIINWEYYGFRLVGITTDADQALRLFRKHKPELIISDIKMPGMSGLELAAMIREVDQKVHILFLSGYKNFDYIKQAIRLDIDDYLLKSDMDEDSFLNKILKLKTTIEKERAKNQYTIDIILEKLFHKNVHEQQYKEILDDNEYIRIHKRYYYVLFAKNIVPEFIAVHIPQETGTELFGEFELRQLCITCGSEREMRLVSSFPVNEHVYLGIFEMGGYVVSQREVNDRMYQFALSAMARLKEKTVSRYSLYYYAQGCPVRQFGRFYEANKQQLWKRYVNARPQITSFGEESRNEMADPQVSSITAEEMYQTIKSGNQKELNDYLAILKIAIEKGDYVTYLWYAKVLMDAMSRFEGAVQGEKSGRRFSLMTAGSSYDFRSPEEVVDFMAFKLEEIAKIKSEYSKSVYSDAIQMAMTYIRENYADHDLSAAVVARAVNLSNSWLSTKFKEEVGVGISDYINGIRVQQAKQLFDSTNDMIYEVAEAAGFTSSQYFSKIFKQFTGLTPNEYKRKK